MDSDLVPKLWELIEPIVEPEGIELVEVEFIPKGPRWMLRIFIDRPSGVTLEDCELVSVQVSALLDIEDPIQHPYQLEVSSPGVDRVLRKEKDFNLYSGSRIRIKTREKQDGRKNFGGILKGMKNSKIVVEVDGEPVEISPENVEKARLEVPQQELFHRNARQGTATTGD